MDKERINEKKVLIVGDIMLDIYSFGEVKRISPEAPVPVFSSASTRYVLGGAANVAANLVAAGVSADMMSIVGKDVNGDVLLELLDRYKISRKYVIRTEKRTTTSKLRYIGQNNQQILRVDEEVTESVLKEEITENWEKLEEHLKEYSMIILSDYNKGFLSESITKNLIDMAEKEGIPVLVDVKDVNYMKYAKATLLKPNKKELALLTGLKVDSYEETVEAAKTLCNNVLCKYVLCTIGEGGMLLVNGEDVIKYVQSTAKEVFDVTGAGDTSLAYFAAAFLQGKSMAEAVEVANYAAGVQVSKVGTSIVYPYEIEAAMELSDYHRKNKQLDFYRESGLDEIKKVKGRQKKIVFTNGCFDILHAGHVDYLGKAKALGDCLVVGVNSDASVKRLKGSERPINNLADRMTILSSLEAVDYVVPFEEDTPLDIIKAIGPDVLVKGGDYQIGDIVGADFVTEHGGKVMTIPCVEGKSTTGIINKVKKDIEQ